MIMLSSNCFDRREFPRCNVSKFDDGGYYAKKVRRKVWWANKGGLRMNDDPGFGTYPYLYAQL